MAGLKSKVISIIRKGTNKAKDISGYRDIKIAKNQAKKNKANFEKSDKGVMSAFRTVRKGHEIDKLKNKGIVKAMITSGVGAVGYQSMSDKKKKK